VKDVAYFKVVFLNLPKKTKENHEKLKARLADLEQISELITVLWPFIPACTSYTFCFRSNYDKMHFGIIYAIFSVKHIIHDCLQDMCNMYDIQNDKEGSINYAQMLN
jgi:hypothetical protein